MARIHQKPRFRRPARGNLGNLLNPVIGDPSPVSIDTVRAAPRRIQKFANERRISPTAAEEELEKILNTVNAGILKGKFQREFVCGKWILDFFFGCNRLGIEVDGDYHSSPRQKKKDIEKEADCLAVEITLLRLTNAEVFGDREALLDRLRDGYRGADRHTRDFMIAFEAKNKRLFSR